VVLGPADIDDASVISVAVASVSDSRNGIINDGRLEGGGDNDLRGRQTGSAMDVRETRYATVGDAQVAYQVAGSVNKTSSSADRPVDRLTCSGTSPSSQISSANSWMRIGSFFSIGEAPARPIRCPSMRCRHGRNWLKT
jgi:hypothetical protein